MPDAVSVERRVPAVFPFTQPAPVPVADGDTDAATCVQQPPWLIHLADRAVSLTEEGQEVVRQTVPDELQDAFARVMANRLIVRGTPAHARWQREQDAYERKRADRVADEWLRRERAGPPSWGRIDPAQALEAARNPREPEVGRFQGEPAYGVFYRCCVNEIHGESESGKSWLALYVVAQELMAGHVVVYVDYEDDEGSVYRRLKLLGVPEDLLRGDLFRYHRPNGPLTDPEKIMFRESAEDADTVIFDGVTEGMSLEGLSPRDEKDVAAWHARATKDLAHAGKCVVVIDHVPHEGNRAIGSQHKKSCITGVSYLADSVHPIGAGQRGVLRLKVEKDRHSSVRREAVPGDRPQWRGDLVIDFSGGPSPDVALWPAQPRDAGPTPVPELSDAQVGYLRALSLYGELGASGTTLGKDTGKARSVAERAMVKLSALGCAVKIGSTSRFGITELGVRALADADADADA